MELTLEELKNIFIFLRRTDLKGDESIAHANLVIKFDEAITKANNPETPEKVTPSKPALKK